MYTDWLRAHLDQLLPIGAAAGVSTPTVWAIAANMDGPEALPWSLVAIFVVALLTGALITLPQHKRELRRGDAMVDRMFGQVDKLIENDGVIIKALEDIKGNESPRPPSTVHRQGRR